MKALQAIGPRSLALVELPFPQPPSGHPASYCRENKLGLDVRQRNHFLSGRTALEPLVAQRLLTREAGQAFTMYGRHDAGVLKPLLDARCFGMNEG